ncbi:MAG: hypothetical protein R2799_00075 [Crocinitomicaceae bacterium]
MHPNTTAIFESVQDRVFKLPEFKIFVMLFLRSEGKEYQPSLLDDLTKFKDYALLFLDGLFHHGKHEDLVNTSIRKSERFIQQQVQILEQNSLDLFESDEEKDFWSLTTFKDLYLWNG